MCFNLYHSYILAYIVQYNLVLHSQTQPITKEGSGQPTVLASSKASNIWQTGN